MHRKANSVQAKRAPPGVPNLIVRGRYLILMAMSDMQFEGQHADEEVVEFYRRHPIVMRKGLLLLLVFWVVGLLPYSYFFDKSWALYVLIGGVVLGLLSMFYSWINWFFSLVIITNQRLVQITQEGLFSKTVVDIGLEKILSVNYQVAGVQQTLLSFGTIIVQTYVGDLVLDNMYRPARVQEKIVKTIKDNGFNYRGEEVEGLAEETAKDSAQKN